MSGVASSAGRSGRMPARANIVGYYGRGGDEAAAALRRAQQIIPFAPLQAAPADAAANRSVFVLGRDSVVEAVDADGSFLAMIGNVYGAVQPRELLDKWLAVGTDAFAGLEFEGFAVAWNMGRSELVLLRDRFGVEAGYYAQTPNGLLFADDQQSLLRMGVDAAVDAVAIDSFLAAGYFAAPLTPYESVRKIPPGGCVHVRDGAVTVSLWAEPLARNPVPAEIAREQIGSVVAASVEKMWPAQGDVALLLSGGIDSGMLAAVATKMLGKQIRAFTFRYDDYDGQLNETSRARIVSDHLGIGHDEIRVTPHEMLDDLDSSVAMYGEPLGWGLHSYKLGPIAASGFRTVLSGSGADGTGLAKRHAAVCRFKALPALVQKVVRSGVRSFRPLGWGRQQKAEWVTRRVRGLGHMFSEDSELRRRSRASLYGDSHLPQRGSDLLETTYEAAAVHLPDDDELSLILLDKRFTFAEGGAAWNRAFTRGNGLAGRYPYIDRAYLELGLGVTDGDGKELLRHLALDLLPKAAANAPKLPQQMPVSHWIRGPLAARVRERLSTLPPLMSQIFDPDGVLAVVDEHVAGSADNGWRIISLLTLESWFRQQS